MSDLQGTINELYELHNHLVSKDLYDQSNVVGSAITLLKAQQERIAELEAEIKSIRQARASFLNASADRPQTGDRE